MDPNPADFPVKLTVPIQWGDQDAFGHVNNIHFLRWFESARIEYLRQCEVEISSESVGPILASVHCDYRRQVLFPDEVVVSASLNQIGNSSMTIQHYLWSERLQVLAAEGHSVIVMFDYQSQKPTAIPDPMRARLTSLSKM